MTDARICVVGGGAAGTAAALRGARLGAEVVLVERDDLGGAWANRGTLPLHVLATLADGGRGSWAAARDAAITAAGEARTRLAAELAGLGVTLIAGDGRATASTLVEVDTGDERFTVHAPTLVLAPGAEPARPEHLDYRHPGVRDAGQLLGLTELPERAVVTGGGTVAVGVATILNRFGVRVVLAVPAGALIGDEEPEAAAALAAGLAAAGVEVLTDAGLQGVEPEQDELMVHLAEGSLRRAGLLVVASGRRPGADEVGAAATGAIVDADGFVTVDADLHTGAGDVYAVGDVLRGPPQAHRARADGERAVEHALGAAPRRDRDAVPRVVRAPHPFAAVGLTTRRAEALGRSVEPVVATGDRPGGGTVVLVVERPSGLVLGVSAVGPGAHELVTGLALPVTWGCTAAELAAVAPPAPGLGEVLGSAADSAAAIGRPAEAR